MKFYKILIAYSFFIFIQKGKVIMNTKQGLRAVLYARFSSDLQRSESIDAQVRAMKKYCEQNHMFIINTYIDEAKSATSDKRPSFQQMIKDSKNRKFDVVLVHKLDRFSRNRYDSAMYKRMLRMNGVRVYSVLENLDDTPESIMLESLLEGMSEYYSKNLAREVMKGLTENALQCKHNGGQPPLGYYVNEDKKLSVDEREAEAVRLIFNRYANGYTYSEIISELNLKKYYTKNGNTFAKNSLYSILTNEKYSGVFVFNKSSSKNLLNKRNTHLHKSDEEIIKIPNGCPQIVDTETFQKVQELIKENKRSAGQYNTKHRYIFSGLVFCGYCGKRLNGNRRYSGRNKSLYVTYRCMTHSDSCINKEINRYYLEDFVLSKIKEYFGYKDKVKKMYAKMNKFIKRNSELLYNDISRLNAELMTINESMTNLTSAIEKGISIDDVFKRSEELQQQKSDIESEIIRKSNITKTVFTDDEIENTIKQCRELIKCPTHPENKAFIKKVIDKIIVKRDDVTIILKTGLSVDEQFNTVITATRDEIYNYGRSIKNAN